MPEYLFYYSAHRLVIEDFARRMGIDPRLLRSISTGKTLEGFRHLLFMEVTNHPEIIPARVREMLYDAGAIFIMYDDTRSRHLYYLEQQANVKR